MIAHLSGKIVSIKPTALIIDVAGVGFNIVCSPNTTALFQIGDLATVHTHLVVREDALTLYGFASEEETATFQLVQSVSGIGPKLALAIVAHLSVAQLRQAILSENLVSLSKVPGVGNKVAQRLVLELKDRVLAMPVSAADATQVDSDWKQQVVSGLQGLGYSTRDATSAWESISEMATLEGVTVSVLMRAALRSLARS